MEVCMYVIYQVSAKVSKSEERNEYCVIII